MPQETNMQDETPDKIRLVKVVDPKHMPDLDCNLCKIDDAGELEPIVGFKYVGAHKPASFSQQDKLAQFLASKIVQPHEKSVLKEIFGNSADKEEQQRKATAQQALYHAFIEEFKQNFEAIMEGAEPIKYNDKVPPVYFFEKSTVRYETTQMMKNKYWIVPNNPPEFDQIKVFATENDVLCEITTSQKHGPIMHKAVQATIRSMSRKLTSNILDQILSAKPKDPSGPGGMQ